MNQRTIRDNSCHCFLASLLWRAPVSAFQGCHTYLALRFWGIQTLVLMIMWQVLLPLGRLPSHHPHKFLLETRRESQPAETDMGRGSGIGLSHTTAVLLGGNCGWEGQGPAVVLHQSTPGLPTAIPGHPSMFRIGLIFTGPRKGAWKP